MSMNGVCTHVCVVVFGGGGEFLLLLVSLLSLMAVCPQAGARGHGGQREHARRDSQRASALRRAGTQEVAV